MHLLAVVVAKGNGPLAVHGGNGVPVVQKYFQGVDGVGDGVGDRVYRLSTDVPAAQDVRSLAGEAVDRSGGEDGVYGASKRGGVGIGAGWWAGMATGEPIVATSVAWYVVVSSVVWLGTIDRGRCRARCLPGRPGQDGSAAGLVWSARGTTLPVWVLRPYYGGPCFGVFSGSVHGNFHRDRFRSDGKVHGAVLRGPGDQGRAGAAGETLQPSSRLVSPGCLSAGCEAQR